MKRISWQVRLGFWLVVLSVVLYVVHYSIFFDLRHIFIYMVGDIAFVPVEVLLVTLIIHRIFSRQEKRVRLEKMNMVIEVFFSELGLGLLKALAAFDRNADKITQQLLVRESWSEREFQDVRKRLAAHEADVDSRLADMNAVRERLMGNRDFLMSMLGNPNLLEHETCTELLRAVLHLTEELNYREDLGDLPASDYEHLSGDIERAYELLIARWLAYMRHLQVTYPYLFSLAMRTNPFDPNASPVVG